jgi:hypothetical protein
MEPVAVLGVDAKLGIGAEDRFCFFVDSAARSKDGHVIARNCVCVLCLVQSPFDGVNVGFVSWEHMCVLFKRFPSVTCLTQYLGRHAFSLRSRV